MEKKDEKSANRHEEGKADASADDPMLKIEEDFESKQFGAVAQNKELDLYLVSFSCVMTLNVRQKLHSFYCVGPSANLYARQQSDWLLAAGQTCSSFTYN